MLLSQITNNSRRTLHRHLIHYTKQICTPHLKKEVTSHKCQTIFYCTSNRNSNANLGCEIFNYEQKESATTECTTDGILPQNKYLKSIYSEPVSDILKIYKIINNELGKECISLTYAIKMDSVLERVKCTVNITWPKNLSFSYVASNKKVASQNATLMCLSWLCKNNQIKGMKPCLYNNEDIQYLLKAQQTIMIDLTPQLKMKIQSLIETFNNTIKSKIEVKVDNGDLKADVKDTNLLINSLSPHQIRIRNAELARHYNERRNNSINLPIRQYENDILNKLQNNQILLIKGETGCGKSTQVPQFIIDAYIRENRGTECNVVVCEPRRVAAISLATHVAMERNETLGNIVGYHVRFARTLPRKFGSILYCTTGVLLRRLEVDSTLEDVTHLIIDEVHERSLHTDLILKLIKDIVKRKQHIKIIIMSATINTGIYERYFSCESFSVPGVIYPVKMHFLDDINIFKEQLLSENNFIQTGIPFDKIVDLIKWIVETKPPGGILCFLPGWQDIKTLHMLLQNTDTNNLLILPLHSKMEDMNQQKIFTPIPDNITKVILATDIAECSITIKDISYVIDTAVKKEVTWDEETSLSSVNIIQISQANILQRKGRAGRVKSGESFHLITRQEYHNLPKFPKSEILRIPLEGAVIISKIFSTEKAEDFFSSVIESPSNISINSAVNNLKRLGILDEDENFTNLGKRVKHLALQPKLSKAVILSCIFQCLNPILSIACTFSDVTKQVLSLDEETYNLMFRNLKLEYHNTSDHIAVLKYLNKLRKTEDSSLFDTFKSGYNNLDTIEKLRRLHINDIISSGMAQSSSDLDYMNIYSDNNELIRAILFASTNQLIKRNPYGYKKGCFTKNANIFLSESNEFVRIKNESVNYGRKTWPSDILTYIYTMKFVKRNCNLVIDTSMISPLTVLLFSNGDILCSRVPTDSSTNKEKVVINIDSIENLSLHCEKEIGNVLLKFRNILWRMVDFLIEHESTVNYQENLREVQFFKHKLMFVLSEILNESSKNIDNMKNNNSNNIQNLKDV